jgi:hypothetical protein
MLITDAKLSIPLLVKMTGHGKLGIRVLLPALTDGRILTPIFIHKIKNLLKGKLPCVTSFICNERVHVTEEHMVEWLTEDQVI